MVLPIRKDYFVDETDAKGMSELSRLSDMGIIEVLQDEVVHCKKCNNSILIDEEFTKRSSMECSSCSSMNLIKSKKVRTRINRVLYNKIIDRLSKQLANIFGEQNTHYQSNARFWIIDYGGKSLIILLHGVSTSNSFISMAENEGVCIYLEPDKIPTNLSFTSRSRFLYFLDEMLNDKPRFLAFVDSLDYVETTKYLDMVTNFSSFVEKISPQQFEKKFVHNFLEGIKKNHTELERLYSRLRIANSTLINSKFIPIGGPGKEDFQLINLLEYLQAGLKPEKFGEAKRYSKKKFTFQEYAAATAHAMQNDTLFIVATNDIQPEVWANLLELKRTNNEYKHILIDKDLILFLLYNLELTSIIEPI